MSPLITIGAFLVILWIRLITSGELFEKLSKITTEQPLFRSSTQVCEPIYPAPPATKMLRIKIAPETVTVTLTLFTKENFHGSHGVIVSRSHTRIPNFIFDVANVMTAKLIANVVQYAYLKSAIGANGIYPSM